MLMRGVLASNPLSNGDNYSDFAFLPVLLNISIRWQTGNSKSVYSRVVRSYLPIFLEIPVYKKKLT